MDPFHGPILIADDLCVFVTISTNYKIARIFFSTFFDLKAPKGC